MNGNIASHERPENPVGLGVRQPSGAFASGPQSSGLGSKAAEDRRTPGRWRAGEGPGSSIAQDGGRAGEAASDGNLWPVGIAVAFVVFVAGTAGLIVLSTRNKVELVSPDYYEQELRFQDQINRRERAQALQGHVQVSYDTAQRTLTLALPATHAAAHATGEIQLYRPSSAGLDRRLVLELDAQGHQTLDARGLGDGLWRVRVTWRVGREDFAFDEKVVIGPQKSG